MPVATIQAMAAIAISDSGSCRRAPGVTNAPSSSTSPRSGRPANLAGAFPDTKIALNHLGRLVGIGAYAGRLKEEFPVIKINPKHKVPLLVVDGKPLSESVAIQTWIARTFPQAKLLPADPWQELQAISLMSWCSGGIHPFLTRINSPARVCDVPGTGDSVKKLAAGNLMELFKIADDLLADRQFFFDRFTAPDAHFFWCQRRARQFELDLSGFKHCAAHFEHMMQRPSVQKLLAFEKSVQDQFAKAA